MGRSSNSSRLAVATIVRDEAAVLADTIASVTPIADEIHVLDTGSTDSTPGVAAKCGAVVHRAAWTGDFAAARNRLLNWIDAPWVLWLDAGERLDGQSAASLWAFIDAVPSRECVYHVFLELPAAEEDASSEQTVRPRLIPNRPDLWFQGRVRETLQPAIEAAGLSEELAPGRIFCHPRQRDRQFRVCRGKRNLELIALERARTENPSVRLLLAEGDAASDLEDHELARAAYGEAILVAPSGSTEMLEAYYGLLGSLSADPAGQERQIPVCLEALEVFPLDAQLLCAMGVYLQREGRLELAARSLDCAAKHGKVDLRTWHLTSLAGVSAAPAIDGGHGQSTRGPHSAVREPLGRDARSLPSL